MKNRDYSEKLIKWVRAGKDDPARDTYEFEDEVYWGVWRQVGGEDINAPDALFRTKEEAYAYGKLCGLDHDWDVSPVVLQMETRDNFQIPEEDKPA